jgi:hypothetical protein
VWIDQGKVAVFDVVLEAQVGIGLRIKLETDVLWDIQRQV